MNTSLTTRFREFVGRCICVAVISFGIQANGLGQEGEEPRPAEQGGEHSVDRNPPHPTRPAPNLAPDGPSPDEHEHDATGKSNDSESANMSEYLGRPEIPDVEMEEPSIIPSPPGINGYGNLPNFANYDEPELMEPDPVGPDAPKYDWEGAAKGKDVPETPEPKPGDPKYDWEGAAKGKDVPEPPSHYAKLPPAHSDAYEVAELGDLPPDPVGDESSLPPLPPTPPEPVYDTVPPEPVYDTVPPLSEDEPNNNQKGP